jgi:hypothetical protein
MVVHDHERLGGARRRQADRGRIAPFAVPRLRSEEPAVVDPRLVGPAVGGDRLAAIDPDGATGPGGIIIIRNQRFDLAPGPVSGNILGARRRYLPRRPRCAAGHDTGPAGGDRRHDGRQPRLTQALVKALKVARSSGPLVVSLSHRATASAPPRPPGQAPRAPPAPASAPRRAPSGRSGRPAPPR